MDKIKSRGAAATAATIAAAGVLIGGSFDAPADILNSDESALSPTPIVQTLGADIEADGGDDGGEELASDEGEEKRRGGLRARTREFVLRLPLAVRVCVAVPLWCVGWVVISLFSLLWTGVLSPAGSAVLRWALIALMLLAAAAITVKTVFPKTPLKKIFNRYTLLWVLGGSTLLCIADAVLQYFYPDSPKLFDIARIAASAALLAAALVPALRRARRAKREREEEEARLYEEAETETVEETPEQAEERVRKEILALADSVSGRSSYVYTPE